MRSAHNRPESRLVTWPDALRAASASGFSHFQLRSVRGCGGETLNLNNAWLPIEQTLTEIDEDASGFEHPSELVELPVIRTVIADGPLAGTVVAEYTLSRRPSVWQRLRQREVLDADS
jgi:hypothetical protein